TGSMRIGLGRDPPLLPREHRDAGSTGEMRTEIGPGGRQMRAKVLITSTAVAGLLALAPTTALASTAGGADLAAMTCHHGSCPKTASVNVPKSTDRGSGDDKSSGVDRGKGDD